MGRLVIADTGLMEIRADYTFRAYQVHKFADTQLAYSRLGIYNTECFDCGKADPAYTKVNKVAGDRTTGFWIGYHPFTLILNVGGATYDDMKNKGKITEDQIPTVKSPANFITYTGRNLNQSMVDAEKINLSDNKRLKVTVAYLKRILSTYKKYYDSLADGEKQMQVPYLYSAILGYAKRFDRFKEFFDITDYIPLRDDDNDGIFDHDDFGNPLVVNSSLLQPPYPGGSTNGMELDE